MRWKGNEHWFEHFHATLGIITAESEIIKKKKILTSVVYEKEYDGSEVRARKGSAVYPEKGRVKKELPPMREGGGRQLI